MFIIVTLIIVMFKMLILIIVIFNNSNFYNNDFSNIKLFIVFCYIVILYVKDLIDFKHFLY